LEQSKSSNALPIVNNIKKEDSKEVNIESIIGGINTQGVSPRLTILLNSIITLENDLKDFETQEKKEKK